MDNIINVNDFEMYVPVEVPTKITDIVEIVTELKNGEILRVVGGDNSGNRDVLIKLSDLRHGFTVISLDTRPESPGYLNKYWNVANISLNYLMTYDVYLESSFFIPSTEINIGDIVEYTRKDNDSKDVAKVLEILVNPNNNSQYAFKLSGDNYLYGDNEITKK